ncbi:uncharacterized protein [Halyomorpha halys]|uniref:uncharacterized protein n=1 Tax=Halyomorpha halys TaxID=286706 RepID=UPI0034D28FA9
MVEAVSSFTRDIGMSFGLDKSVVLHVTKGKVVSKQNILVNEEENIKELEARSKLYKYLGMQKYLKIFRKDMQQEFLTMLKIRQRKVLKTQLTGKQKIKAINTWAISALSYSFGIVQWSNTSQQEMDRLVRTTLTQERTLHPISAKARLYLPRKGGRGLQNIEEDCHKRKRPKANTFSQKQQGFTSPSRGCTQTKKDQLNGKKLEGYSPRQRTSLRDFVLAIQDQVIATRSYRRHVLKDATAPDKCRLCSVALESIQHITGGCAVLAGSEYLQRHNNAAKILHQALAVKYNLIEDKSPYYKYHPNKKGSLRLYWDESIITDHTVRQNNQVILLIYQRNKKVDVGIANDNNLSSTVGKKLGKCQELVIKLKKIYKLEGVTTTPFIISKNGFIPKSTVAGMNGLGVPIDVLREAQQSVLLDTTRIMQKFLNI